MNLFTWECLENSETRPHLVLYMYIFSAQFRSSCAEFFWSFLFALPLLGAAFIFSAHSHTHRCSALFIWNIKLSWIGCMQFWIFSAFTPHSLCCCERLFFFFSLDSLPQYSLVHVHFMPFFYVLLLYRRSLLILCCLEHFFFFSFHPKNHNNNKKSCMRRQSASVKDFFTLLHVFFYRRQI